MPGEALSLSERVLIEKSVDTAEPASAFGARLGRACSTITREFERNGGRADYSAATAHARATAHWARPRLT